MITSSIGPMSELSTQLETAEGTTASPRQLNDQAGELEFQSLLDAAEPSDGFVTLGGGAMQLARNVETGKANMQTALMRASLSASPTALQEAVSALSRYDLQTLFLSKVANKAFQAVDRLTNLQ